MILCKKRALFPQPYYEVCKRSSPKEQTDSSELTQAMPAGNRKDLWVMSYLLLCTFWREIFKYSLKERKKSCLLFTGVEIKTRRDEMNCQWSSVYKTGTDQSLLPIAEVSSTLEGSCPHPSFIQLGHQGTLQLLIVTHPHFFCSVESKVQVGTGDLGSGGQLGFVSYAAWKCTQVWLLRSAPSSLRGWMMPPMQLTNQQYIPWAPCLIWRNTWLCFTWGIVLHTCHGVMRIQAVSSQWYQYHHYSSTI